MILLDVLIERGVNALNRPFTYLYPFKEKIEKGVRVLVSFRNKDVVGYVLNVYIDSRTKEEYEKDIGFTINSIKSVLDNAPILNNELISLANQISSYYLCPLISVLQTMLPASLKPRSTTLRAPKIHYEKYIELLDDDESNLTSKQIEIIRFIKNNKCVKKREIKSLSSLKKLIETNKVKEVLKESFRYDIPSYLKENKKDLTLNQKEAVNKILNAKEKITLLEGVTGSGKTEVYLSLAEKIISQNKTVLMLVPEISLTGIMVEYFLRRFENDVAILHSELTNAEKYDEYRRIAKGDAHIVVGTRSAIFAPLENIGLIILDEEHVDSYKQDNPPSYHAREVALMRAKVNNSIVVLGSATPLLETRIRAMKGLYNYVLLKERINKMSLPKTFIVDMLDKNNISKQSYMFSNLLIEKIKNRLEKKEQIILLINRRGFATSIVCKSCGETLKCPNCGIPLAYHFEDNLLKCHHCDYVSQIPLMCPNCGGNHFSKLGFGTEKIEKEINSLFPNARTLRLDSDVGKIRNNITNVIEKFRNNEADILIGTQMIAKGHDFPNVTLVGVVLADIGLNLPSFRNSEKVFNLITQAIGRSGRDKLLGEAVVQTYRKDNYAIKYGSEQDYNSFFKKEMFIRKQRQYPPYTYLISVTLKAKKEDDVIDYSDEIIDEIKALNIPNVTLLGPSIPYIPYNNGLFTRRILIKYKKEDEIRNYLVKKLRTLQNKSTLSIIIDVDPYDF